jgi:hypothetical protein
VLPKQGVFTYQITETGYRNEMCVGYRKRLCGWKKRDVGFCVGHKNERWVTQMGCVGDGGIFSSMKMVYTYLPEQGRERIFIIFSVMNRSRDIVKICIVWCYYYLFWYIF